MSHRRELFLPPVSLDRAFRVPLHRQIYRQLASSIVGSVTHSKARLPSSRVMAKLLSVSRNTVLLAYDELAADGLIRGKRGAGMWVNGPAPTAGATWFGLRRTIHAAGYPAKILTLSDMDGNLLYIRA